MPQFSFGLNAADVERGWFRILDTLNACVCVRLNKKKRKICAIIYRQANSWKFTLAKDTAEMVSSLVYEAEAGLSRNHQLFVANGIFITAISVKEIVVLCLLKQALRKLSKIIAVHLTKPSQTDALSTSERTRVYAFINTFQTKSFPEFSTVWTILLKMRAPWRIIVVRI